jgi:hypothetical protein
MRHCYRRFLQMTRHIFRIRSNTHLNLAGELVTLDRTYMTYHVVGLL